MVPNGWDVKELRELVTFSNGKGHEKHICEVGKYIVVNSKFISSDGSVFKRSNESFCPASTDDILMVMSDVPNGKAIAKCFLVDVDNQYTVNQRIARFRSKGSDPVFLFYSINRNSYYLEFDDGLKQTNLRKDDVLDCPINTPPLPEQRKIAQILSTWDKAIATTEKLIETSKQQKKALMQQLLTGKKRLVNPDTGKAFEGDWKKVELGKLLDYKQPTPYLVKSTEYSNEYPTPVLTAGKTFILGYSNEDFGILREALPVIIFDDFTTASKFVDFPFKAKSSAMKILIAKDGVSIKYVYEAMQVLNYPVGGHQRHWISIFANLVIGLPEPEEQQKIASVLTASDKEIELLESKLAHLKQEKKALMQQLLTGKRRVKVDEVA
jgi:type I restriction enzyme S subunit